MEYFDEFSGFCNEERERAEEEARMDALNARLAFRLHYYSYEEALDGLFCALTFRGKTADVIMQGAESA